MSSLERLALKTAIVGLVTASFCAVSAAQTVSKGTALKVKGTYHAPESAKEEKPRGLSGMACLGSASDPRRQCLVVIDDEKTGQVVVLTKDGLEIGTDPKDIVQFTTSMPGKIAGTERPASCEDKGKFGELDGEGVAVADGRAYVVGSHSCSGGGKYKSSSYLLARFKIASKVSFGAAPAIEYSWRVADVIRHSPARTAYGKPKDEGSNIEGLAVSKDNVYFGLRTPVDADTSYILGASANALFAEGGAPYKGIVRVIPLPLGEDTGIRDLAALDSGGLLVLSGPTKAQDKVGYKIWHLPAPIDPSTRKELVTVKTDTQAVENEVPKAESLTILAQGAGKVVVLVNYDNVNEGAPTRHEISLK